MQEVWPVFITQSGDDGESDELKAVCSDKLTAKAWLMGATTWYLGEIFGGEDAPDSRGHSFRVTIDGSTDRLELRHDHRLNTPNSQVLSGNSVMSTLLAYSYREMVIGPSHAESDGERLGNL